MTAAPMIFSVAPEDLYAEPKLLSVAQFEKKLPKAEREALAPFVESTSSGTNLVPIEDARKGTRPTAEDEFAT